MLHVRLFVSTNNRPLYFLPYFTTQLKVIYFLVPLIYRGRGIYWVKGSVPVLFWNFHHRGERGKMGGSAKFQIKAHRTFDPRNNSTPVFVIMLLKKSIIMVQFSSLAFIFLFSSFEAGRSNREKSFFCQSSKDVQNRLNKHGSMCSFSSYEQISPQFLKNFSQNHLKINLSISVCHPQVYLVQTL